MSPMTPQSAAAKRKNLETIYPLAPLQEGILFHCLTAPDTGTYMPQIAFHLQGPLDGAALKSCWKEMIDRHQLLRAGVHWEERDEPFQVIYREVPMDWNVLDWSDTPSDTHADALQALYAENRQKPFDLRRPPLLRLQLVRLSSDRHILVLCHHHIILDGWSTSLMLREAFTLYHQARGLPVQALPPPRPYGDYIKWLKRQDSAATSAYWQDYLADTPGPSLVFGDQEGSHDFARTEWDFPQTLVQKLEALLAAQGLTLSTLLHGVLGLQIARHLGRSDVFFGSATSGRPAALAGATAMVGLFINALPVRVRFQPSTPIADWLAKLQRQQAATMAHEHIALRHIQKNTGTLFDCLLVIENYPTSLGEGTKSDIQLSQVEFDEWTHFPLTLLVATGDDTLKLILRHDRSVLPPDALQAFVAGYAVLLEQIVDQPDAPIEALIGALTDDAPVEPPAHQDITAYTAPETETELLLAGIWAEVLRKDDIGVHDNFFDNGGHSLLAVKVITRVRRDFELELPVRALFDRPTLAGLATYIDALSVSGTPDGVSSEMVMEF